MIWRNRTSLAELAASATGSLDKQLIIMPQTHQTAGAAPAFVTGGVFGGQEGKGKLTPVSGGIVMTPKVQSLLSPGGAYPYQADMVPSISFGAPAAYKPAPIYQAPKKTPQGTPAPDTYTPPVPTPQEAQDLDRALSAQQGALVAEYESLTQTHKELLKQLQMAEIAEKQKRFEELQRQAQILNEEAANEKARQAAESRKSSAEKFAELVSEAWSGESKPKKRKVVVAQPARKDERAPVLAKIRAVQDRQAEIQSQVGRISEMRVSVKRAMSYLAMDSIKNAVASGGPR